MPVPTNTRYDPVMNTPSLITTPARSNYLRNTSNASYSPTVTSGGGPQKLNVVTRVAIEGKAKRGQDGASIRMFLKICLPLDSVTPGSTIPLFPEENVKIHSSQVHPLDHNSVPYNFSSTVSPLLHSAARALNLPARSHENFTSAFSLPKHNGNTSSNRHIKSETVENIPPVDTQYTGQILVSGYSISFVLPKIFLSHRGNEESVSDNDDTPSRTPAIRRRLSSGERNQAQFMAAIDMWVPFICRPPRSPYLLSIPSPRCLHNHIKLRIFPPANTAASFASLSSVEEDSTAWDLTSDPHVTRSASTRPSRHRSYTHFADDESSESSTTGLSEGCVIQGTFPSAERVRVRWAKPMRNLNIPGEENGRRRVGVEEVKGAMTCNIRGKGTSSINPETEGVLMHVEYKGECKGVWFPGVATLLGLDVGLEAKGSDITWPKGYPAQWEVSGGLGYTGFDNGTPSGSNGFNPSRTPSLDTNTPAIHISTPGATQHDPAPAYTTSRTNSTSSTSSLLRAPLPAQNVAEYSFEGSNSTLPSASTGTLSSMESLPASSTPNVPKAPQSRPPGSPITLHINMNDLQPLVKNTFSFSISGTVLVTARPTLARINGTSSSNGAASDKTTGPEPIVLPRFTVLAADSESTHIAVHNEVESASIEVFHPTGDIHNDPQAKKTVLQKGGFTRCNEEGGRIALKYLDAFGMSTNGRGHQPPSRPRTPSTRTSSSPIPRTPFPSVSTKRDGPCILPWVNMTVTGLAPDSNMFPTGYAVRVCLQTPALVDTEWLEFGMADSSCSSRPLASISRDQKVHIICASLDGIPVKAETITAKKESCTPIGGVPFEELSGKDWIYWGKVYAGPLAGRSLVIDYIVKDQSTVLDKGKQRACNSNMNILLPTFFVSVARLEVNIDAMPGLEISSLRSNFDYHYALPERSRLLRYSLEEFSHSRLSFTVQKSAAKPGVATPNLKWYFLVTWIILLVGFYLLLPLNQQIRPHNKVLDEPNEFFDTWSEAPTVTVTTTFYGSAGTRRWFGESPIAEASVISSTRTVTPASSTVLSTSEIEFTLTTTPTPTTLCSSHQDISTTETSLSVIPSRVILENFGLIPIENMFTFTWSNEHVETLNDALETVIGTMQIVWNLFRKVYHYPLDPP